VSALALKHLILLALFSPVIAFADAPLAERFQFASDVPANQVERIQGDLAHLETLEFKFQDSEALATLDIPEMSGRSLGSWLSARVHYILSEAFDPSDSVYVAISEDFHYENTDFPTLDQPATENVSTNKPKYMVAQNLSSAIYYNGKMYGQLLEAEIPGLGTIPVRSPRVGIMKIGEGLFQPLLERYGWSGKSIDTETARLIRLGALFHEARHSDGNGKSLGFFHARCPEGHDYAGRVVCDRSLNGAYAVGGLVERNLLKQCEHCTVAEREAFRLYTYDSFNRIIHVSRDAGATVVSGFSDARPEGNIAP
jgi:hypothetical protein